VSDLKTILDQMQVLNDQQQDLINQARAFQQQTGDDISIVTTKANSLSGASTGEANAFQYIAKDPNYFDLIAFWPLLGTNKRVNYLDPEDTDEAGRLTGDFTNHDKGILVKAGSKVDTHISPFQICGIAAANIGVGYFIQSAVSKLIEAPDPKNYFRIVHKNLGYYPDRFYANVACDCNGVSTPTLTKHIYVHRNGSVQEIFNNGTKVGSESRPMNDYWYLPKSTIQIIPTEDVIISCLYLYRSPSTFDTSVQAFIKSLNR